MEFRIELMDDEYAELARLACSRVTPAGIAKRAKAVLAVAQGNSMSGAGREVEMTLKHVRKWCKRVHAEVNGSLNILRKALPWFLFDATIDFAYRLEWLSPRFGVVPMRVRA